jgi:hypothetical protein
MSKEYIVMPSKEELLELPKENLVGALNIFFEQLKERERREDRMLQIIDLFNEIITSQKNCLITLYNQCQFYISDDEELKNMLAENDILYCKNSLEIMEINNTPITEKDINNPFEDYKRSEWMD